MEVVYGHALLLFSVLLFAAIIASKTSGRLGVPALILFMAIGVIVGSDGLALIHFDSFKMTQTLGVIALSIILFSGGLDTRWSSVKPVMWKGISLATIGVIGTAFTTGLLVYWFTDFSFLEGLLLGSIVASTDAAAVFSVLRSKNIELKHNLRPVLEFESGSNDPMAYMLTLVITMIISGGEFSGVNLVFFLAAQLVVGSLVGIVMGKAMVWITNRIHLTNDGLYSVMIFALALFTYAISDVIKGNGFLSVYIAGVILGNSAFMHKRSISRFFDGLAWLMQIVMFVALGLLVYPTQIVPVVGIGVLTSVVLMFVSRPVGVFLSLIPFKLTFRDRVFISWVGLRGAVPIVLATFPIIAGVEKGAMIFNVVFFVVAMSVLVQGTTFTHVAKWLRLSKPIREKTRYPLEIERSEAFKNELLELEVNAGCFAAGKSLIDLNLPMNALIVMINRNGKFFTPNGSTVLEPGDKMLVLTDSKTEIAALYSCLGITEID